MLPSLNSCFQVFGGVPPNMDALETMPFNPDQVEIPASQPRGPDPTYEKDCEKEDEKAATPQKAT